MVEEKRTERSTREKRASKPDRIPVGGFRDKLTVRFNDPEHREKYYARWVLDTNEQGAAIVKYFQAGYEFIPSNEVTVGQTHVFKSEDVGTIVRQPADKEGRYLYLMRLPIEFFEEDQKNKARIVDESEESLYNPESLRQDADAVYGKIKIQRDLK